MTTSSIAAGEFDNTQNLISKIEKLPRSERLQAYIDGLKDNSLASVHRVELIRVFAKHTIPVSLLYGKSTVAIDERAWADILRQGYRTDPNDHNIVLALAQILINHRDYEEALQVLGPYHKNHPESHEAAAWFKWALRYAGSGEKAQPSDNNLPVFDIHFCVITKNPQAATNVTIQFLYGEIGILNKYFRSLNGRPIVQFRFKSASFYDQVKGLDCELVKLGDSQAPYDSNKFAEIFNHCDHKGVRDPRAINFYIYDSYDAKTGYADTTCHGKRNSNCPYLLIDCTRLNHQNQAPEEHEMGHAFGLYHVGVPGAGKNDSTNIMTSSDEGFGSGGKRDLGFTEAQRAIIVYHAERTMARLENN